MNTYKIHIRNPFTFDDPMGKWKKGDIGIYEQTLKEAIKKGQMLEITIAGSNDTFLEDPKIWKKNGDKIKGHFKLKSETMKLYTGTPTHKVDTKILYRNEGGNTPQGMGQLLEAMRNVLHT